MESSDAISALIATVGCPLLGKCADGVRPGRPGRPAERSDGTLLGWSVSGPRMEEGVVFSGVSQHAEFNLNIHFV